MVNVEIAKKWITLIEWIVSHTATESAITWTDDCRPGSSDDFHKRFKGVRIVWKSPKAPYQLCLEIDQDYNYHIEDSGSRRLDVSGVAESSVYACWAYTVLEHQELFRLENLDAPGLVRSPQGYVVPSTLYTRETWDYKYEITSLAEITQLTRNGGYWLKAFIDFVKYDMAIPVLIDYSSDFFNPNIELVYPVATDGTEIKLRLARDAVVLYLRDTTPDAVHDYRQVYRFIEDKEVNGVKEPLAAFKEHIQLMFPWLLKWETPALSTSVF